MVISLSYRRQVDKGPQSRIRFKLETKNLSESYVWYRASTGDEWTTYNSRCYRQGTIECNRPTLELLTDSAILLDLARYHLVEDGDKIRRHIQNKRGFDNPEFPGDWKFKAVLGEGGQGGAAVFIKQDTNGCERDVSN